MGNKGDVFTPTWWLQIRMADVEAFEMRGDTLFLRVRNPAEMKGKCFGYGFPIGYELDFSDFADRTPEEMRGGAVVEDITP